MVPRRKGPLRGGNVKQGKDVIYVVGYARLPAETTAKHVYDILSLGIALERESGRILEVSCTDLPPYGNEFIRDILLGKKIEEDLSTITEEIRSRYICRTSNALLAALEDLLKRFKEHERRTRKKTE
jgi:hypothetical protein